MAYDFRSLLVFSATLRMVLIIYGEWQDAHMEVRYTDVDYLVFSDAASLMASGRSPYGRSTYRYSPLLAFLLLPNSIVHPSWGKFLFSASGKVLRAAFWYGLVVHFRIYPIIYAIPILLVLDPRNIRSGSKPSLQKWGRTQPNSHRSSKRKVQVCISDSLIFLKSMVTRERILFGLISGSVFFCWTGIFFHLYGWEFLNEALLYHLTRTDPRHNFSIYFYHIYLHHEHKFSILEKLVSFLPQLMVQVALIVRFAQDLPFCFFVQTVAFVAFNKVITAQYFVWYFCLLPLLLPWSNMNLRREGFSCIIVWMGAQIHWLMWGYLLEFKGKNVFVQLWCASLIFLAANTWVLIKVMRRHEFSPIFIWSENTSFKSAKKLR